MCGIHQKPKKNPKIAFLEQTKDPHNLISILQQQSGENEKEKLVQTPSQHITQCQLGVNLIYFQQL